MKTNIYAIRLFLLLTVLLSLIVANRQPVQAQADTPKLEWGVHSSALHLSDFTAWQKGLGSRVTYNLNHHLALEGEINVFLSQNTFGGFTSLSQYVGDRQTEGLFGVKAGKRFSRIGLFGKLRPGMIHFGKRDCNGPCLSAGSRCRLADGSVIPCPQSLNGKTKFALDMGGVLEFYFSRRFAFRLDVGDTVISASQPGHRRSHNLQLGTGISFRF